MIDLDVLENPIHSAWPTFRLPLRGHGPRGIAAFPSPRDNHSREKWRVTGERRRSPPYLRIHCVPIALAGKQVGKIGPNALHVGDEIKVKCIPAKDGHPLGFLKSITYADGHVIVVSGGGPND